MPGQAIYLSKTWRKPREDRPQTSRKKQVSGVTTNRTTGCNKRGSASPKPQSNAAQPCPPRVNRGTSVNFRVVERCAFSEIESRTCWNQRCLPTPRWTPGFQGTKANIKLENRIDVLSLVGGICQAEPRFTSDYIHILVARMIIGRPLVLSYVPDDDRNDW